MAFVGGVDYRATTDCSPELGRIARQRPYAASRLRASIAGTATLLRIRRLPLVVLLQPIPV